MTALLFIFYAVTIYVVTGLGVAIAFVSFGLTAVMGQPATIPARILIVPGAVLLWPYMLWRWQQGVKHA